MSHTYTLLEVSKEAYEEISSKLKAAGYTHAFGTDGEIDMHGLAVIERVVPKSTPQDAWDRAMDIIR